MDNASGRSTPLPFREGLFCEGNRCRRGVTSPAVGPQDRPDRRRLPSRNVVPLPIGPLGAADSIEEWASRYLDAAVCGVRSVEVAGKIALHLARFRDHFADAHG